LPRSFVFTCLVFSRKAGQGIVSNWNFPRRGGSFENEERSFINQRQTSKNIFPNPEKDEETLKTFLGLLSRTNKTPSIFSRHLETVPKSPKTIFGLLFRANKTPSARNGL
jgi:hypothetical protein